LRDFFADKVTQPPIQIFATDISEPAIDKARSPDEPFLWLLLPVLPLVLEPDA
jgi:hypothetical protein